MIGALPYQYTQQGLKEAEEKKFQARLLKEGYIDPKTKEKIYKAHPDDYYLTPIKGNAWQQQAEITRRRRQAYEQDYRPLELRAIDETLNFSPQEFAEQARESSVATSELNRGITNREFERYGRSIKSDYKADLSSFYNKLTAASADTAATEAYHEARGINDQREKRLVNIGQGIASSSQALINQASELQSGREARNEIAKAQGTAGKYQTAAALGGLGYLAGSHFLSGSLGGLAGPVGLGIGVLGGLLFG